MGSLASSDSKTPSTEKSYWVRFEEYNPGPTGWHIILPIQPHHYRQLGVEAQKNLTGSGPFDGQMVMPRRPEHDSWSVDRATEYCVAELQTYMQRDNGGLSSPRRACMIAALESLNGATLSRAVLPPCKPGERSRLSVEITVPDCEMQSLLTDADKDVEAFAIMQEFGFLAIENGLLDDQPADFRTWFNRSFKAPKWNANSMPKEWKLLPRNFYIYCLVRLLTQHGYSAYRNDEPKPSSEPTTSACDVVALAAKKANLPKIGSYQTVKAIHKTVRKAWNVSRVG